MRSLEAPNAGATAIDPVSNEDLRLYRFLLLLGTIAYVPAGLLVVMSMEGGRDPIALRAGVALLLASTLGLSFASDWIRDRLYGAFRIVMYVVTSHLFFLTELNSIAYETHFSLIMVVIICSILLRNRGDLASYLAFVCAAAAAVAVFAPNPTIIPKGLFLWTMATLTGCAYLAVATRLTVVDRLREREAELQATSERLTSFNQEILEERDQFFNVSSDLLCVIDPKGYFKQLNPAWHTCLGFTLAQLKSKPWLEFVHPEDRAPTGAFFLAFWRGDQNVGEFEGRFTTADGGYRWLKWSVAQSSADKLIYASARDITGAKNAEKELQQHAQELARSNEELQQFAYVASHDLQEPLRMVASYTSLLKRRYHDKLDQDANEFIDFAVDGALRMKTLIQDLLAYSRVGTKAKEFQWTDLGRVMANVVQDLKVSIDESKAVVVCDDLPTVMGEETQLGQLFLNLVGNAIKFRGDRAPHIHVSVQRLPADWQFSVKDNGIGIERQYFERIFQIFQRLHAKTDYAGTGIGLAVCKKIVARHGGRIWVESVPGVGSTFYFTLPA